jgi:3-oxoacyl-[acyl-carrier protein] reductase
VNYSGIKNNVAIVTGAGEGIGYAVAELLVKAGAKVVLNDVDSEKAKTAAQKINALYSGSCLPFPGDASDISTVDALVDFTLDNFGKINFIVPNAGITLFGNFLDFTPDSFQRVVDLNLKGAFFLAQRAAKEIIKQGDRGSMVFMSSQVGIQAYQHLTAYGMTKAALQMMAKNLAYVLGKYKITTNTVAPGATLTERTAKEQPDYEGIWSKLNPNGRVGRPDDIAKTVLFLLSEEASHINGQTIPVDGGWTVGGKYPEDLQ